MNVMVFHSPCGTKSRVFARVLARPQPNRVVFQQVQSLSAKIFRADCSCSTPPRRCFRTDAFSCRMPQLLSTCRLCVNLTGICCSVELHVLQQIPEHIVYLHSLLALTRTHPLKKSVAKRVVAEDTVWWLFATLLAHEVVDRFGPSRPVLYWRGGACSRISMVPARRRNTRGLRFPQRSASRLNRIMSPIMVNEL